MIDDKLFSFEQKKYDFIHKKFGNGRDNASFGRQVKELTTRKMDLHEKWRECITEKMSFLEVGLGCGAVMDYWKSLNIEYFGVDISTVLVDGYKKENYNVECMSSHQLNFADNSFDVVQHLDGMEHIPIEWEEETLKEEIRVAKKYVFHANAMCEAWLDQFSKPKFNELHINVKNSKEWDTFYESNSKKYNYKIVSREVVDQTYYVVLEKN